MVTFMIVWMRRHARGLERRARGQRRARARRRARCWRWSAWRSSPSSARASRPRCSCSPRSRRLDRPGGRRRRRGARHRRRGRARLRHLPRRRAASTSRASSASRASCWCSSPPGLVATALHTAHEAGWLNGCQGQALDLSWLVEPGTRPPSLLTGMLGLQPQPDRGRGRRLARSTRSRCCVFVLWPQRWRGRRRRRRRAVDAASADADSSRAARRAAGCGRSPRCGSAPAAAARRAPARRPAPSVVEVTAHRRRLRRRRRSKLAAGPTTFKVDERRRRARHRVRGARRRPHPRRGREHRAGPVAASSRSPCKPGTLHAVLPRRHDPEHGTLDRHRRSRGTGGRRAPRDRRGRDATASYVEQQTTLLVDAHARRSSPRVKAGDVAKAKELYAPARASPTSGSSRWPRASATSTRRSTRARATCPPRKWTGFHRIEQALWVEDTTDGMAHARRPSCSTDVDDARSAGRRRSSSSRPRSRTAPSSCSARCRSRRSPARRSATRTPTSSTSRPTSTARRRRSTLLAPDRSPTATRRSPTTIDARFADGRRGARRRTARGDGFVAYTDADARRHARALRRRSTRSPSRSRRSAAVVVAAEPSDPTPSAAASPPRAARRRRSRRGAARARRRRRRAARRRRATRRRRRRCRSTATHQAGIATPAQDRLALRRLRRRPPTSASDLRDLLRTWTRGRRADDGGPSPPAPANDDPTRRRRHRRGARAPAARG